MKFINWGLWGLLAALLTISSGCSIAPSSEEPEEVEVVPAEGEGGPAKYIPSPNPYLENRPTVPPDAQQRFREAKAAMLAGDYATAENNLHWLTENYPNLSGSWLNLALLYQQQEKTEQADSAFQEAIKVNAKNLEAFNQYGIFLRKQGQFGVAELIYLRGLEEWPDHAESRKNLGILYDMYMGRFEEALEQYQWYQKLQAEPDRQVEGWIVDLERRIESEMEAYPE